MNYDWNFYKLLPYWEAFLSGTITTLSLTITVIILGTFTGILLGFLLNKSIIKIILYPIIDIIRALPPLVLILFIYYLFTEQVIGTTFSAYWVCVVAMTVNLSAFTSDLVRSAIQSVPKNYVDAARALGLERNDITFHIILPSVFRQIIPAMTMLYIGMLKMSSLASVINVQEIVYNAQSIITNTTRSLEAWTIVALIYLIIVLPATFGARRLEDWSRKSFSEH